MMNIIKMLYRLYFRLFYLFYFNTKQAEAQDKYINKCEKKI